jgi:hypothetical protein
MIFLAVNSLRRISHENDLPSHRFPVVASSGSLRPRALHRGSSLGRVSLIRVKPTQMDAYLTSLRQSSKPILDEQKRQGIIVDYKFFLKETKNNPEDWDVSLAIEYKNHAAMDGLPAKGEMLRDKIIGGKQPAQQLADKRAEIREVISSELLQEIILK